MLDLTTTYMGLHLKNPLVASASPLSKKLDTVRRLQDAGAAAIVMYSLFEEQITHESYELDHYLERGTHSYAEALSYFPDLGPHYAASKAGLLGLMHWLAASLAPHGVTVNAVAPALIAETGMIPGDQKDEQELLPRIPVGRHGKPEDVAEVIMTLISNSYLTSQTISIDGGLYPR